MTDIKVMRNIHVRIKIFVEVHLIQWLKISPVDVAVHATCVKKLKYGNYMTILPNYLLCAANVSTKM